MNLGQKTFRMDHQQKEDFILPQIMELWDELEELQRKEGTVKRQYYIVRRLLKLQRHTQEKITIMRKSPLFFVVIRCEPSTFKFDKASALPKEAIEYKLYDCKVRQFYRKGEAIREIFESVPNGYRIEERRIKALKENGFTVRPMNEKGGTYGFGRAGDMKIINGKIHLQTRYNTGKFCPVVIVEW